MALSSAYALCRSLFTICARRGRARPRKEDTRTCESLSLPRPHPRSAPHSVNSGTDASHRVTVRIISAPQWPALAARHTRHRNNHVYEVGACVLH